MPQQPENKSKKKKKKPAPGASAADWALWRSVAETITPLPGKKAEAAPPEEPEKLSALPRRAPKKPEFPGDSMPLRNTLPELAAGAPVGLDKRTAQRLRRGQIGIEARLDLHHMTQAEAHRALIGFIEESVAAGRRTVLVITGKGLKPTGEIGVLRTRVPHWLNQPPVRSRIVAFCEAAPKDGGAGALYLRLKKFR
ncbi:MAG: Smr/MutS family protein [Rhodospirillales bacterium]